MAQLKSIEYNDDGTIDITNDTGTKFTGCYLTSKGPTICSGDETIVTECVVTNSVVERLQEWQMGFNQRTGTPETRDIMQKVPPVIHKVESCGCKTCSAARKVLQTLQ